MERKKKFIVNVVFYALILVLVWVGFKYLVTPMMPFIIAFNIIKAGINGIVTFYIYKRISNFLRDTVSSCNVGRAKASGRTGKSDTESSVSL